VADPWVRGAGLVIHPRDLSALRVEIHNTTMALAAGPGSLEARVPAQLTRQLRLATGADASLYARGWAHVPPPSESKAGVIVMVVLMVLLVGLVILMLAGTKGKGSRSGGHGSAAVLGGVGRAVTHAAAVAGHIAVRTLPLAIDMAARAHGREVACYTCAPSPSGPPPPPDSLPPPDSSPPLSPPLEQPVIVMPPPRHESDSPVLGLAISLVQNSTGRVLWHASQTFEVEISGEVQVEKLIEHFFAQLPWAR
jgi:hypothetical protein